MLKARTVVLIPCYNNMEGLLKTVKTIKHHKPLDVLIVDDGSEEGQRPNEEDFKFIKNKNVSIEVIRLGKNSGITDALNEGLKFILDANQHEFIARVDCGDTCKPNRFRIQEEFLDLNPEIRLVGSWVKWKKHETNTDVFEFKPPKKHKHIKRGMSLRCNIIHPTVMYRTSVVNEIGLYSNKYESAEDYAYFFSIANKFETANIPRFLTHVEYDEKGISVQKRKEQNQSKIRIIKDFSRISALSFAGRAYTFLLMGIPLGMVVKLKKALL